MTSPRRQITVSCPSCGEVYEDWHRASINLTLGEVWTDDELREAATATCPRCEHVVELETLVVENGVWTKAARPPLDLDSNTAGQDWIRSRPEGDER